MPDITIEMPDGLKLRSASKRRYIVAAYHKGLARWGIMYRTDKESNALARWRQEARLGSMAHVIDTQTKAVIR